MTVCKFWYIYCDFAGKDLNSCLQEELYKTSMTLHLLGSSETDMRLEFLDEGMEGIQNIRVQYWSQVVLYFDKGILLL